MEPLTRAEFYRLCADVARGMERRRRIRAEWRALWRIFRVTADKDPLRDGAIRDALDLVLNDRAQRWYRAMRYIRFVATDPLEMPIWMRLMFWKSNGYLAVARSPRR
jgi:hypothetical protein